MVISGSGKVRWPMAYGYAAGPVLDLYPIGTGFEHLLCHVVVYVSESGFHDEGIGEIAIGVDCQSANSDATSGVFKGDVANLDILDIWVIGFVFKSASTSTGSSSEKPLTFTVNCCRERRWKDPIRYPERPRGRSPWHYPP